MQPSPAPDVGPRERAGVWAVVLLATCCAAASLGLTVGFHAAAHLPFVTTVFANAAALSFPAVGAVVVLRGGNRAVGWTLIGVGVMLSADAMVVAYAEAYVDGRALPLGRWACWTDEWVWIPLLGGMWLLLALFPDGRPFRRAGRWYVAWAGALCLLLLTVRPFHSGALVDYPQVRTPLPRVPLLGAWADAFPPRLLGPLLFGTFVLALATLVHRYLRSDAVRRAQLRWLAWEFGVTVTILLVQQIPPLTPALSLVSQACLPLLPVAIGLAMFRERLWDIDRVISRTVSWGLLTGLLAALYAGVVTLGSTAVPERWGAVGVAAATLAVAALFGPARRRVQAAVDRRFDRVHVSARRVAEEFGRATRRDPDPHRLESDLLTAVETTVAPAHVGLWLVPRGWPG